MRLGECILKCYECRKTSRYEELEIITLDGKDIVFTSTADMEMPIVDKERPQL